VYNYNRRASQSNH